MHTPRRPSSTCCKRLQQRRIFAPPATAIPIVYHTALCDYVNLPLERAACCGTDIRTSFSNRDCSMNSSSRNMETHLCSIELPRFSKLDRYDRVSRRRHQSNAPLVHVSDSCVYESHGPKFWTRNRLYTRVRLGLKHRCSAFSYQTGLSSAFYLAPTFFQQYPAASSPL